MKAFLSRFRCGVLREDAGQVIPFVVILLPVLVALVGTAVDLGFLYYERGQLQSATDAAALAGAQQLPNQSLATSTAQDYSAAGSKNDSGFGWMTVNQPSMSYSCTVKQFCSVSGFVNAVTVTQTAQVPTLFLRVLGVNSFNVTTEATGCSPCGTKPLDVLLVTDRSGSMGQDQNGAPSPDDMNNLRDGVKSFLQVMDPETDHIGLVVFPPSKVSRNGCAAVDGGYSDKSDSDFTRWAVVPLSSDYKVNDTTLNTSSNLVKTVDCLQANGGTDYADAIDAAQQEFALDGRSGAQKVIVFMSDGAAKDGAAFHTDKTSPYWTQPCQQGVNSANAARSSGIWIYSIGYGIDPQGNTHDKCTNAATGKPESPEITPYQALQGIADFGNYFNKPTPGDVTSIFLKIASDMSQGTSRLVDNP